MSVLGHHHHNRLRARIPGPAKHALGMLTLERIKPAKRDAGGYTIRFKGYVPRHATVRLFLGNSDGCSMDITKGYNKHSLAHFTQLLDLMDQGDFWGEQVLVRVAVCLSGKVLTETISAAQYLQCPVEPLRKIGVEEIGKEEGLVYTGNRDGTGGGACLSHPIGGKYYCFSLAGMLETAANRRGLDCTTFAGGALGVPNGLNQTSSEDLASRLKPQSCGIEAKSWQVAQKYLEENKTGTYLMWSHGHIVVVKDGKVHEFTWRPDDGVDGYDCNEVSEWFGLGKHKHHKWTVRKLNS